MLDALSMIPIAGQIGPAAAAAGPPGWLAAAPMVLQGLGGLFGGGGDRTTVQPVQPRQTPAGPWTGIAAGLGGGYR